MTSSELFLIQNNVAISQMEGAELERVKYWAERQKRALNRYIKSEKLEEKNNEGIIEQAGAA